LTGFRLVIFHGVRPEKDLYHGGNGVRCAYDGEMVPRG